MLINEFVATQLVRSKNDELKKADSVHRAVMEYISEFKAQRHNGRRNRKDIRR